MNRPTLTMQVSVPQHCFSLVSLPATEQEEELGEKHCQFECVKHAILVVTEMQVKQAECMHGFIGKDLCFG